MRCQRASYSIVTVSLQKVTVDEARNVHCPSVSQCELTLARRALSKPQMALSSAERPSGAGGLRDGADAGVDDEFGDEVAASAAGINHELRTR